MTPHIDKHILPKIEYTPLKILHNFPFKVPISESSIRGTGAVMSEECAAECASTSYAMRCDVKNLQKSQN